MTRGIIWTWHVYILKKLKKKIKKKIKKIKKKLKKIKKN